MSTQIPSRPLLHHEINAFLAAELEKRAPNIARVAMEEGALWCCEIGQPFSHHGLFTSSLDTLALLEKHLTPDEARTYAIACFRGCSYTEILMMAPVKRARILAQVLRGEAA